MLRPPKPGMQSDYEEESTVTFRVNKVGQISLTMHDLPRALAFYQGVLQLPLLLDKGE